VNVAASALIVLSAITLLCDIDLLVRFVFLPGVAPIQGLPLLGLNALLITTALSGWLVYTLSTFSDALDFSFDTL
jgi:hypothetical protein